MSTPANLPHPGLTELLAHSRRTLFFTGAGISTGSGIPDFRGPQGVWKSRDPVYYQAFLGSEEARVEYWDQKAQDWERYRDARPNSVHLALAAWERAGRLEAVVTQNIDGLHAKAGTSAGRLVELHGTNSLVECQRCGQRSDPEPFFVRFRQTRKAPVCGCGGFWKPATISFGQSLKPAVLERGFTAAARADLIVALGSTLSVTPASQIPCEGAMRGTPYVVINRGQTEHDGQSWVRLRLEGDVAEFLPPALQAALGRPGQAPSE